MSAVTWICGFEHNQRRHVERRKYAHAIPLEVECGQPSPHALRSLCGGVRETPGVVPHSGDDKPRCERCMELLSPKPAPIVLGDHHQRVLNAVVELGDGATLEAIGQRIHPGHKKGPSFVRTHLRSLQSRGFIRQVEPGRWVPAGAGASEAPRLRAIDAPVDARAKWRKREVCEAMSIGGYRCSGMATAEREGRKVCGTHRRAKSLRYHD